MSKPKPNKAQLKQAQRGSRHKPRKSKKARPLASETRKVLAAGKKPSGETHRPTLAQRKSLASKVAYIIERLKPTPEERAEFRELARTVARKLSSNRQGRRA